MKTSLRSLRVAIYARFSSENQRDASIEDQVRLCREFIGRNEGDSGGGRILTDYAVSGRSIAREGFDELLRLVETRMVDVVVTESGDRLTRDLGDADRLWKLCQFNSVRVICVSDGIDSIHDGARMAFRFKAVMADEYLHDLSKKTARGLWGAAMRGQSTGGLPYGYTSAPILSGGREPEGFKVVIDAEKAAVVQRIFELYVAGHSMLSIAAILNNEGVPPPRHGTRSKKRASKFWRKTTLREIVRNEAYIGTWVFGTKQWRRDPRTRKRMATKRPEHELARTERPHLRIVAQELWDAAKQRRDSVAAKYAGKCGAPGRRTAHPFSGLLHCKLCGHAMVDNGGGTSRHYRCAGAVNGGICSNRRTVREDVLIKAAVEELKRVLLTSDLHKQLQEKIARRIELLRGELTGEERRLMARVEQLKAEVERVVNFVRMMDGASPAAMETMRSSLEQASRELREAELRLEAVRRGGGEPVRLPTIEEFTALCLDVEARIKNDPTAAREALRTMLSDGRLEMEPLADGTYKAHGIILPVRLPAGSRKPRGSGPTGASGASSGNDGCAGPKHPMYTAVKIPAEVRLAA